MTFNTPIGTRILDGDEKDFISKAIKDFQEEVMLDPDFKLSEVPEFDSLKPIEKFALLVEVERRLLMETDLKESVAVPTGICALFVYVGRKIDYLRDGYAESLINVARSTGWKAKGPSEDYDFEGMLKHLFDRIL